MFQWLPPTHQPLLWKSTISTEENGRESLINLIIIPKGGKDRYCRCRDGDEEHQWSTVLHHMCLMALATLWLYRESFRLYVPSYSCPFVLLVRIIITIKRIPWICEIKIKIQDKKEVTANSVLKKAHQHCEGECHRREAGRIQKADKLKEWECMLRLTISLEDWATDWATTWVQFLLRTERMSVKSFEFTWVKQNMTCVLVSHKETRQQATRWTRFNPFRLKRLMWQRMNLVWGRHAPRD